jgi:hypothetical protein
VKTGIITLTKSPRMLRISQRVIRARRFATTPAGKARFSPRLERPVQIRTRHRAATTTAETLQGWWVLFSMRAEVLL